MKNSSKLGVENEAGCSGFLVDRSSSGRKRSWSLYKSQSLAVSDAYKSFEGVGTFSKRMEDCGAWLRFLSCPLGHGMLLVSASFCRCRLCPLCQWRRSLIMFHQVKELAHEHIRYFKSDVSLFLTLTVPNVLSSGLSERLDLMQSSWNRLINRKFVRRVCRSWFRALEVTYSVERDDYHPHFHVLLMVPRSYFDYSRGLYISRDGWLAVWREVTGLMEITQVDVRKVKRLRKRVAMESISAEVAKYATKPGDYVRDLPNGLCEADAKVVEVLHDALRGRRLVAFGGKFKEYRKRLKMQEVERSDMVHVAEKEEICCCRICQSELISEMYRWRLGLREYVK